MNHRKDSISKKGKSNIITPKLIWGSSMKAYEYYGEILPDGHLSLPEDLREKLKSDSKIRVMLLLDEDEKAWDQLSMSQFLKGYSEKDAIYDNL